MNNQETVVLDLGLWEMKIGFAGDEGPRFASKSLVGHSKNYAITTGITKRDYFVGQEALIHQTYYDIFEIIQNESEINI